MSICFLITDKNIVKNNAPLTYGGHSVDKIVKSDDKININANNYYIIDTEIEKEKKMIIDFGKSGLLFGRHFTTIWAMKCQLSDGNYSYTLLNENKPPKYNISELITLMGKNREICFIYGNCQITVISRMLSSSDQFRKNFITIQLPEVFKVDEYNDYKTFTESLKIATLFIYQHVKKDNRFGEKLSTDILCEKLNPKCRKICFPNSYVGFYYPQWCSFSGERIPDTRIIPYADENVQKIVDDDNFSRIDEILLSESLYSKEYMDSYLKKSIDELKDRERFCDVIISDYILDNYQSKCIGYSPNHPTNEVLKKVAQRILNKLNIHDDNIESKLALDQFEMIIYPAVIKHLGLMFTKNDFIISRKITPRPLSIKQYCIYLIYYTNPNFFYRQLNKNVSPGLSISKEVLLLENKSVTIEKSRVYIQLLFRTFAKRKVIIQLPQICHPNRIVPAVCIAKDCTYLLKIMPDGHIEFEMNREDWALIDTSFEIS